VLGRIVFLVLKLPRAKVI